MAKIAAGRCALEVTSRIFEVMGARATASRYRFDRFWRNVRTLTLHDPLDLKVREVGDWVLNGRHPTPGFYS
jgi:alkylation response protein AidB-like acyl-CoA dehydrogenase